MILGISGRAGSGKDAAASVLVRERGFVRVAFADSLKRIAADLFGWDEERLWGPSARRNEPDPAWQREHGPYILDPGGQGPRDVLCACCGGCARMTIGQVGLVGPPDPCFLTARFALQTLGTEVGRALHPDVWVRATMREIAKQRKVFSPGRDLHFVIPDVRFRNEAEAVRAAGGFVLRVVRPGAGLEGAAGEHASETELTDGDGLYDARIVNDGMLEEFEGQVAALGSMLVGRVPPGPPTLGPWKTEYNGVLREAEHPRDCGCRACSGSY